MKHAWNLNIYTWERHFAAQYCGVGERSSFYFLRVIFISLELFHSFSVCYIQAALWASDMELEQLHKGRHFAAQYCLFLFPFNIYIPVGFNGNDARNALVTGAPAQSAVCSSVLRVARRSHPPPTMVFLRAVMSGAMMSDHATCMELGQPYSRHSTA